LKKILLNRVYIVNLSIMN